MYTDNATVTVPTEIDALRAELATAKRDHRELHTAFSRACADRSIAIDMLRCMIDEHAMGTEIKDHAISEGSDAIDFARRVLDIEVTRKFRVTLQYTTEVYVTVDADDEEDANEKASEVNVRIDVNGDIDGADTDYFDTEVTYCEEAE